MEYVGGREDVRSPCQKSKNSLTKRGVGAMWEDGRINFLKTKIGVGVVCGRMGGGVCVFPEDFLGVGDVIISI